MGRFLWIGEAHSIAVSAATTKDLSPHECLDLGSINIWFILLFRFALVQLFIIDLFVHVF